MKKTLIAVAALVATGAFAQSTVTISGVLDAGLSVANVQATTGLADRVTAIAANNIATSAIVIAATEDLGGGMKANVFVETNPDMAGTSASAAGIAPIAGALKSGAAFGGGQRHIGLSGGFGTIKMGAPNNATIDVIGMSSSFGTALGGGNSSTFSRTGVAGIAGAVGIQTRIVRAEKSVRYDSPVMNGFTASFNFSAANSVNGVSSTTGVQTIGLTYSNGPLNAGFATTTAKNSGTTGVAGLDALASTNVSSSNTAAATLAAGESITYNALAANYNLGATTIYAGYTTNKRSIAGTEDGSSINVAAKYQLSGAVSLAGNYLKKTDALAAANGGKVLGLGLNYDLSKRTTVYARYEKMDTAVAFGNGGERTTVATGISHSF